MTSAQSLPERDKFLIEQLDGPVRSAFESLGLTWMSGPADRYGVIEWLASVDDFARLVPGGLDTGYTKLNAAIAAWTDDEDTGANYDPIIQVTIAARTPRTLARWVFPPLTLPSLAKNEAHVPLRDALRAALESDRTQKVVWSALSPENAPSDMKVLPLIPEERIIGDEGF